MTENRQPETYLEVLRFLGQLSRGMPGKVDQEIKKETDPASIEKPLARKTWRCFLMWVIALQLIITNAIVVSLGLGYLFLSSTVVSVFVTGVFAQVAGFVYIALKHDFSQSRK